MNEKPNSDSFGSIQIPSENDHQEKASDALSSPEVPEKKPAAPANGQHSGEERPTLLNISPKKLKSDTHSTGESKFSRKSVQPKKKGSLFLRILKVTLFCILIAAALYTLTGFFLFPYLIKTYGAQQVTKLSGRPVTISQAKFNPLTFRLELGNSVVGPITNNPNDTIDPIMSFSRLVLELSPRSFSNKGLICNEFSVNQLFVHISRDSAGRINLKEIWDKLYLAPIKSVEKPETSTLLHSMIDYLKTHYSLNNISLKDSEIIFTDATTNKKHHINNLHIALPTLATIDYQNPIIKPNFSAHINGKQVSLTANPKDPKQERDSSIIQFNLNTDGIDVVSYKNYLPVELGQYVFEGRANLNVLITYNPRTDRPENQLELSGSVTMDKVILKKSTETITLNKIQLEGWLQPLSSNFSLNKLIFTQPIFTLKKTKQGPFVLSPPFNLIHNALSSPNSSQQLSHLEIIRGKITLINKSATVPTQEWHDINLTTSKKSSPAKVTSTASQSLSFSFMGNKGLRSKLSIEGILETGRSVKGIFEANDLNVDSISTLSDWFSDSSISKGTANQIKSNFSYSLATDNKNFTLDNMQIKAEKVTFSDKNTPLAIIDEWQSENGFFSTSDPVMQLGAVAIKTAKFYAYSPSKVGSWLNIITGPSLRKKGNKSLQTSLSSLKIDNSSIVVKKKNSESTPHILDHFQFSAPQIIQAGSNLYTASATLNNTPINTSGTFTLRPFSTNGHISADALSSTLINQIFAPNQQFRTTGLLRVDGSFGLPSPSFEGAITLSDFSLTNPDYTFESRRINTAAARIESTPLSLSLGQISLEQPHIKYTLQATSPSILSVFTTSPTPNKKGTPFIKLDSLLVRDGKFSLYDNQAKLHTEVDRINGSFYSPNAQGDKEFSFKAQLDNLSPLSVKGVTSLLSESKKIQTTYQISDYPALQKNSLVAPILGHQINSGNFDLSGIFHADQSGIKHSVDITTSGLKLGKPINKDLITIKSDIWKSTPLLQALLQNKAGDITIPLSFESNVVEKDFALGDGLVSQFEKLLLKTKVSPFSLLSDKTKTGPITQTLFFPTGTHTLSPPNQELIDTLASILLDRPLLKIGVTGSSDSNSDQKALINEKIAEINRRQRVHEEKLSQALSSSYGKEIIDQPFNNDYATSKASYEAAKKTITITDKNLLELAQKRAEEVVNFLKTKGVPDSQVTMGKPEIINSQQLGREGNRVSFNVIF